MYINFWDFQSQGMTFSIFSISIFIWKGKACSFCNVFCFAWRLIFSKIWSQEYHVHNYFFLELLNTAASGLIVKSRVLLVFYLWIVIFKQGDSSELDSVADGADYNTVRNALKVCDFTSDEQVVRMWELFRWKERKMLIFVL